MNTVLKKNMGAHKQKNRLTSIIYALTLGCIIFLLTSANLQISTINQISTITNADIIIEGESHSAGYSRSGKINIVTIDDVIRSYSD